MKLQEMRIRLVSYGYHPDEVEYAIMEVLQYKSSEFLDKIDFKIIRNMLEEKIEITRAKAKSKLARV